MKTIKVALDGGRSYDIIIGSGASEKLSDLPDAGKRLLVFDDKTLELYGERFKPAGTAEFSFGRGETDKTIDSVLGICRAALAAGVDRTGCFTAVGGGVTGDLTGFAAGIYLRGVSCIQVPTTLLAMVDSSVGGKTAADLPEGKNLIGVFHQPEMVLIDTDFLQTLPVKELRNGLAEVVKMAAGFDAGFFEFLERNSEKCATVDGFSLIADSAVGRCCELKAEVVAMDECEGASGIRAKLNYGHTFGHAVESSCGFRYSHGECVAIGMVLAGIAAMKRNLWSEIEQTRLVTLLQRLQLPTTIPDGLDFETILAPMLHDKKNVNGMVTLILPCKLGELTVMRDFKADELRDIWIAGGGK